MSALGELTSWDVAVLGKQRGVPVLLAPDIAINKVSRGVETSDGDRFALGVLSDPKDETIGLDQWQWDAALQSTIEMWKNKKGKKSSEQPTTPSGPAIRKVRGLGAEGVSAKPDNCLLYTSRCV